MLMKNPTYIPLRPQSFSDFDWLAVLDSTGYNRGGPALGQQDGGEREEKWDGCRKDSRISMSNLCEISVVLCDCGGGSP